MLNDGISDGINDLIGREEKKEEQAEEEAEEEEAEEEEAISAEDAKEQWDECVAQLKAFISFFQVSSMLGATYAVPWPPIYESILNIMSAVNIDVSMIRKPLNDFMRLLGDGIGRASCNFNDMSAEEMFWFHYSLLGLIALAITLACIFSFAFNKLHVPLKGFGEGEFKSATVISQAIATFDFFVFLLYPGLCKRCVMMLQCKPVIGDIADGPTFFLGIDMSMGCLDPMTLRSSVGTAAIFIGLFTMLMPLYYVSVLWYFRRQPHRNKKYPEGVVTQDNIAKEGEELGERISMLDCEDPNFPVKKTCGF